MKKRVIGKRKNFIDFKLIFLILIILFIFFMALFMFIFSSKDVKTNIKEFYDGELRQLNPFAYLSSILSAETLPSLESTITPLFTSTTESSNPEETTTPTPTETPTTTPETTPSTTPDESPTPIPTSPTTMPTEVPTTTPTSPDETPPYCKDSRYLVKDQQEIDCGVGGVEKYECTCLILRSTSKCTKTYTLRGCSDGKCYSNTYTINEEKYCANGCDTSMTSPNYGHCKDDCNPRCSQCQKCFTWNTNSYCIAGPDGGSCTTSGGRPGICRSGYCQPSSCVESSSNSDGPCRKCNEQTGIFEPDNSKNGASCTSTNPPITDGFCYNGVCIKKNCQNLGGNLCGSGTNQACCVSGETCCGANSNNPLCCGPSETCQSRINLFGFYWITVLIRQIKESHPKNPDYILTPADWLYIYNTVTSDSRYMDYFCDPTQSRCEADGNHKLCVGTYGNACCPRTGPGSDCITYTFYPPQNIGLPGGIPFPLLRFTIGMCGNEEACPSGTFECTIDNPSSSNQITGGKLCCNTGTEICGTETIYGGPSSGSISGLVTIPVCKPLLYCPSGYSDCVSVSSIYGVRKICCKNGNEVCINFPIPQLRCAPLPTPTNTSNPSLTLVQRIINFIKLFWNN